MRTTAAAGQYPPSGGGAFWHGRGTAHERDLTSVLLPSTLEGTVWLTACCNSSQVAQKRTKAKKAPDARKPISTPSTADGHSIWPVPWLAKAMAELWHAIGIDRRRTRAQVVQPPCTVGVVGRRKTTCISFCAISSCCGHAYANPDDSAHGDTCGACADHESSLMGRPVQEEIAQKDCS